MKIKKFYDQYVFTTNEAISLLKFVKSEEAWHMDEKFNAILSVAIIPQVVDLIVKN